MRIVVTGAAGFIGSNLAESLLRAGAEVLCIDEVNDYYDVEQKKANLQVLEAFENFTFIKADLRKSERVMEIFSSFQPEKVVHLAARAGVRPSLQQPELYYQTNLLGTLSLLEASRVHGVKTFIFGSSSSVYGSRDGGKFSEQDRVDYPISPYAATKKAGEELCYAYHDLYGINITCLRFFTVFGPRARPDMAPFKFMRLILDGKAITRYGDGSTSRDYTFVGDIVKGILSALERQLPYEIINLGNDSPIRLSEMISTVEKVVGKEAIIEEAPAQSGDVPYTCADISKAKELLSYEPSVSLEEGLRLQFEWMQSL